MKFLDTKNHTAKKTWKTKIPIHCDSCLALLALWPKKNHQIIVVNFVYTMKYRPSMIIFKFRLHIGPFDRTSFRKLLKWIFNVYLFIFHLIHFRNHKCFRYEQRYDGETIKRLCEWWWWCVWWWDDGEWKVVMKNNYFFLSHLPRLIKQEAINESTPKTYLGLGYHRNLS
jgi:hypothetical protein